MWSPRDDAASIEAERWQWVWQDHLWQQHQQHAAFQAQQQHEAQYAHIACDTQLAAEMQCKGYGQLNLDPKQI
jgi:hypothetical protein